MSSRTLFIGACLLSGCSGSFWRSCTESVVGTTVQTTKEVTTGIADGFEEGRKAGASIDGATIVTQFGDLAGHGGATVHEVRPLEGGAIVVLAIENTGTNPLRIVAPQVELLDTDGFVQRPSADIVQEMTVPPQAKDKLEVVFSVPPQRVAHVRLWGQDLAGPPAAGTAATPQPIVP